MTSAFPAPNWPAPDRLTPNKPERRTYEIPRIRPAPVGGHAPGRHRIPSLPRGVPGPTTGPVGRPDRLSGLGRATDGRTHARDGRDGRLNAGKLPPAAQGDQGRRRLYRRAHPAPGRRAEGL